MTPTPSLSAIPAKFQFVADIQSNLKTSCENDEENLASLIIKVENFRTTLDSENSSLSQKWPKIESLKKRADDAENTLKRFSDKLSTIKPVLEKIEDQILKLKSLLIPNPLEVGKTTEKDGVSLIRLILKVKKVLASMQSQKENISNLLKDTAYAIDFIKNHPLKRVHQIIERMGAGETKPSTLQAAVDKIFRYAPCLISNLWSSLLSWTNSVEEKKE